MAFSYPDLVASSTQVVAWLNTFKARVVAIINAFPGGNLVAASVTQDKLAKGKAHFPMSFWVNNQLTTANVSNLVSFKLPNVDGASNSSWRYLGSSIGFRTVATVLPVGALIVLKKNGSAIHSIPVDSTKIAAGGGTYQEQAGSPVSCTSADDFDVDFTAGASGDVTGITLVHYFSLNHVGT